MARTFFRLFRFYPFRWQAERLSLAFAGMPARSKANAPLAFLKDAQK